jgi:hypothetical protein
MIDFSKITIEIYCLRATLFILRSSFTNALEIADYLLAEIVCFTTEKHPSKMMSVYYPAKSVAVALLYEANEKY